MLNCKKYIAVAGDYYPFLDDMFKKGYITKEGFDLKGWFEKRYKSRFINNNIRCFNEV
jgi:hypothetical protein